MTLYKWSQTAASDATADSTINWAEGQAPSSINDSARAMMAAIAKYRDDTSGSLVTGGTGAVGGTSSAYTVSSNQGFTSLTAMRLSEITFVCPATNASGVTLNVDGLGAQVINGTDGNAIPAGTMLTGGVYTVTAYSGEFILHSFFGNPYNIPLGPGMEYWLPTVPNSSFAFPTGQTISTTTYATLFALMGTMYNTGGEPAGTFRLPNKAGRVSAMKEPSPSLLTSSYFGGNSTSLGATGGAESQLLNTNQIPAGLSASVSGPISVTSTRGDVLFSTTHDNYSSVAGSAGFIQSVTNGTLTSTGTASLSGSAGGSGGAHPNVQPTIICNYIMRII